MGGRKIRALALDLDHTLLRSDRTLSPRSQKTLEACARRGIFRVIATARPWRGALPYVRAIGAEATVALNGAALYRGEGLCREEALEGEWVRSALERAEALEPEARWSMETADGFYANFDVSRIWPGNRAEIVSLDSLPRAKAYKLLFTRTDRLNADTLSPFLPEEAYVETAEGTLCMVLHRRATKLRGVRAALEALGVSLEETAAFGDDLADIGILEACGVGVAVENALPRVKAAADQITAGCDEDGVARWIEENLLKEEWQSP